jgi:hypothetical protein
MKKEEIQKYLLDVLFSKVQKTENCEWNEFDSCSLSINKIYIRDVIAITYNEWYYVISTKNSDNALEASYKTTEEFKVR